MTRNWTPRQKAAITAKNQEILVSAAAGSGKTSVLIQRVQSLLESGVRLDRMLVITFTNAAAGEMRERLTALLQDAAKEDPSLRWQYKMLSRADISTLHSFCKKLIARHFQAADTDPMSELMDDNRRDALFSSAMDEALTALFEDPDPGQQELIARFSQEQILSMGQTLYHFLMAQDAPFAWLDRMLAPIGDLFAHPWYAVMRQEARLRLLGAQAQVEACLALCDSPLGPAQYKPAALDDQEMVRQLLQKLQEDPRALFVRPKFTQLARKKKDDQEDPALNEAFKAHRQRVKDLILEALSFLPDSQDSLGRWMDELQDLRPSLEALAGFVKDLHQRYQKEKRQKALWDFNDLEHLALKALSDPLVHQEVSGCYDVVFVDEYQDISKIQEAIIDKVRSPDNALFMVGDVKQSIYRFRLADPGLFLHKYHSFESGEQAPRRLITLKENFRSQPNILQAVNQVFSLAMQEEVTEIAYDGEAALSPGRQDDSREAVEVWLLDMRGEFEVSPEAGASPPAADPQNGAAPGPQGGQDSPAEGREEDAREGGQDEGPEDALQAEGKQPGFVYQCRLIARRIQELVGSPLASGRQVRYRDIAILLRTAATKATQMAQILSQAGIPSYSDADAAYYEQAEVRDMLNILSVLDNPQQDIPLLSTLACPAFGLSPEELARLRIHDMRPDRPLFEAFFALAQTDPLFEKAASKLAKWRFWADNLPLQDLIRRILRDSGIYAAAGAQPEGELRRANLRLLAARAQPGGEVLSLFDFLQRVKGQKGRMSRERGAALGMQEDVVRIMTLHKSKGLEFPVVFLADLQSPFKGGRQEESLVLADAKTGLSISTVDLENRMRYEGFGMRALRLIKERQSKSEEARLLYVGMTRAREKLILVGAPNPLGGALKNYQQPQGAYAADSAKCMLDWVGISLAEGFLALTAQPGSQRDCLYTAQNGAVFHLNLAAPSSLAAGSQEERPALVPPAAIDPDPLVIQRLKPREKPRRQPLKTSVTALVKGGAQAEEDQEETPEDKRRELAHNPPPQPLPLLKDSKGLSGAQKGAAAHKALCALSPRDFVGLPQKEMAGRLRQALLGLTSQGILLTQEQEALDPGILMRFYQSELAARLARSQQAHAEWAFTLQIEGGTLLQGVLDACFLEEEGWVLIDYKTDWGSQEELLLRYRDQMRWYMRALSDITGIPVKEAWLYLLRLGEAVEVSQQEPIRLQATQSDGSP